MSGTGYQDPECVKTATCSKCGEVKTWNYWYHSDSSLCDDCYYVEGKYYSMTKEEILVEKDSTPTLPPKCKIRLCDTLISGKDDMTIIECNAIAIANKKPYFVHEEKIFITNTVFSSKHCDTGFTVYDLKQ